MTAEIYTIIREMARNGEFQEMLNDPMVMFGDPRQGVFYLGATILPEQRREDNIYDETEIQFEALIADDSGTYSTPQAKQAGRTIHMEVRLGNIDAKRNLSAKKIDRLAKILSSSGMRAMKMALMSMIREIAVKAIQDKKELKRWESFRDGKTKYISTNTVTMDQADYLPPADLRFDAGVDISDDAVDVVKSVILPGMAKLKSYGYETDMIACRASVMDTTEKNQTTKDRASNLTITSSLQLAYDRIVRPDGYLNQYLARNRIPPIITYDGYYRDADGQKFYLEEDEIYFFANSPKAFPDLAVDNDALLQFNNLGYYAIGTCQSEDSPGDVIKVIVHDDGKPNFIEVIADSESLPVILNPEGICVIRNLYNL